MQLPEQPTRRIPTATSDEPPWSFRRPSRLQYSYNTYTISLRRYVDRRHLRRYKSRARLPPGVYTIPNRRTATPRRCSELSPPRVRTILHQLVRGWTIIEAPKVHLQFANGADIMIPRSLLRGCPVKSCHSIPSRCSLSISASSSVRIGSQPSPLARAFSSASSCCFLNELGKLAGEAAKGWQSQNDGDVATYTDSRVLRFVERSHCCNHVSEVLTSP